jgi:ribonuclease R
VRVIDKTLGSSALGVYGRDRFGLNDGDVVKVQLLPAGRGGPGGVRVLGNLGPEVPFLPTEAALAGSGLRGGWPADARTESDRLAAWRWQADERRTDWRSLPFVTIDGADARDFDDAVQAEPEGAGWVVRVAIADVAFYVRPGSALDAEARARGNSTYFPDRVIPMLPERLSNDLCSLRPDEDRPVLGVEMRFGADGEMTGYKFVRAAVHSLARLTYEQVSDSVTPLLSDSVSENLRHLFGAYEALAGARARRGALDLDLPEPRIALDAEGRVAGVTAPPRLVSHRLIEEMMIAANVAAASLLSKHAVGGLYRIHDRPKAEKLEVLRGVIGPLGFPAPSPGAGPKSWARLVQDLQKHPAGPQLLRQVLQAQQQAQYQPRNIGHFGLGLALYAHFTSPIRRYADLVVHRAILATLKPGRRVETAEGGALDSRLRGNDGGGRENDGAGSSAAELERLGLHLGECERKSQRAEWDARDRYIAQWAAGLVGQVREGVVVSVQRFGCFVNVGDLLEGLLPGRLLADSGYVHHPKTNVWQRGRQTLRVGSKITVRLAEADVALGRITFATAPGGRAHPPD